WIGTFARFSEVAYGSENCFMSIFLQRDDMPPFKGSGSAAGQSARLSNVERLFDRTFLRWSGRLSDGYRRFLPVFVTAGERPFSERTTAVRRGQRNRARHRGSERRTGFESKGSETMNSCPARVNIVVLVHVCLLMLIHSATASTIQELYSWCQREDSTIEAIRDKWRCGGIIQGVLELMIYNSFAYNKIVRQSPEAAKELRYLSVCVDRKDITYGAAQQAFLDWAAKHPENGSREAITGVVTALAITWRCPRPE